MSTHEPQMPDSAASPIFELTDRYVERFAALDPLSATGEGIVGHDHEMTDFSPAGSDERAMAGHRNPFRDPASLGNYVAALLEDAGR